MNNWTWTGHFRTGKVSMKTRHRSHNFYSSTWNRNQMWLEWCTESSWTDHIRNVFSKIWILREKFKSRLQKVLDRKLLISQPTTWQLCSQQSCDLLKFLVDFFYADFLLFLFFFFFFLFFKNIPPCSLNVACLFNRDLRVSS